MHRKVSRAEWKFKPRSEARTRRAESMTTEERARHEAGLRVTDASYASLLAESDEAAAVRWQTLDDSGLDVEIDRYRAALRAATAELDGDAAAQPHTRTNGETFSSEPAPACANCAQDGAICLLPKRHAMPLLCRHCRHRACSRRSRERGGGCAGWQLDGRGPSRMAGAGKPLQDTC